MTDTVAYALREEYTGTVTQVLEADADGKPTKTLEAPKFSGGVIAAGDEDLNLAELLEEGNGVIVVDPTANPLAVVVLDEIGVLKRVPPPADAAAAVGYRDRTATALRERAGARGIAGTGNARHADLVAALEADDARVAAGQPVPPDYSVTALVAAGPDAAAGDPATATTEA
jgi:hypothetical protein